MISLVFSLPLEGDCYLRQLFHWTETRVQILLIDISLHGASHSNFSFLSFSVSFTKLLSSPSTLTGRSGQGESKTEELGREKRTHSNCNRVLQHPLMHFSCCNLVGGGVLNWAQPGQGLWWQRHSTTASESKISFLHFNTCCKDWFITLKLGYYIQTHNCSCVSIFGNVKLLP